MPCRRFSALRSDDDFHLREDSPCRDAGDSEVLRPRWRDLDGERRIPGLTVDSGADEFPAESPRKHHYEDWAAARFPAQTDPAIIGPDADPDEDGLRNLVEFAFDLMPTEPNHDFAPLRLTPPPEQLRIEFSRPSGISGVTCEVLQSTNLVTWQPLASPLVPSDLALEGPGVATVRFGPEGWFRSTAAHSFLLLRVGVSD